MVLKLLRHAPDAHEVWGSSDDPSDPYYWRREALAYRAGLFAREDIGLRSARCYALDESVPDRVLLYLEDLAASDARNWPLDRFRLAALHLGRFQGEYAAQQPLPVDPWLSRGFLRSYLRRRAPLFEGFDELSRALPPLLAGAFPRSLAEAALSLWQERERWLGLLETLPRTVCHFDFWPPNLAGATDRNGHEVTAVIDLAFAGIGALGEDIGNLVPDALFDFFVEVERAAELSSLVFEGYLAGLRQARWRGDSRIIRLAFTASAALKYAWIFPASLRAAGSEERLARLRRRGHEPAEFFRKRAVVLSMLEEYAAEARRLARGLGIW